MTYPRYVEALWSPDGSVLAINDHRGSDLTECVLYAFHNGIQKIDLLPLVERQLKGDPAYDSSTHLLIETISWRGRRTVALQVSGYGDHSPNGFKRRFEYVVGANTLTRK